MRYGVDIRKAVGDGVVHGIAEDDDVVANEIFFKGDNDSCGGGIFIDCCVVADRFMIDIVGISETDGDRVLHGGVEKRIM